MNRIILLSALASCLLLPSCRLLNQRVDFSWFRDTMTPPQSDSVYVESGQGLPATAVPVAAAQAAPPAPVVDTAAPAPTAPVAAAAAPAPAEAATTAQTPAAAVAAPAKPVAAAARTHTVAQGDTLGAIAKRYNSTVPAICTANGLTNPNALKLGTVLTIPSGTGHAATAAKKATAQAPAGKRSFWKFWKKSPSTPQHGTYTVRQGDTINAIAHRHGVTPAALMQANGIGRGQANKLSIGQKLIIPAKRK